MPRRRFFGRQPDRSREVGADVVVTGARGLIGGILRDGLQDTYRLSGLDVAPGPGVDRVADMTKPRALERAFEGVRAVVDLAADPRLSASWDSVRANNLPATLNALEAAREAGVRTFVFASSNHVVGLYERDEPYASIVAGRYGGLTPETVPRLTSAVAIRPDSPYGVGKALGEAAGRFYAEVHGMCVICLRIGTVSREDRPRDAREYATLLTHRDLVQLVRRSLEAPESLGFRVYYGVSANRWRFWDIDDARDEIGYTPEDDAGSWR